MASFYSRIEYVMALGTVDIPNFLWLNDSGDIFVVFRYAIYKLECKIPIAENIKNVYSYSYYIGMCL